MNDHRNDNSPRREYSDAEVVRLVADAGPRPQLTDLEAARLRQAATQAWETTVRQRRLRRWSTAGALAASVMAGIAVVWWLAAAPTRTPSGNVVIASIARTLGPAGTVQRGATATLLAAGDPVRAGDRIVVARHGGLALELDNGIEIRLDSGATVVAQTAERLYLESGRLYADSGPPGRDRASVTIRTAQATARDIGTQFQVVATPASTRVLVREGRVEVERDSAQLAVEPGQALAVDMNGRVERSPVAPDAQEWRWTLGVAANPNVDGEPVIDLLEWVARETGKTLVFSDVALEADARRIRLRGTIGTLTPLQSLDAMLAATNLDYELTAEGAILVKRRPGVLSH